MNEAFIGPKNYGKSLITHTLFPSNCEKGGKIILPSGHLYKELFSGRRSRWEAYLLVALGQRQQRQELLDRKKAGPA
ncbi:hypothetical protein [Pontibacter sp. H249]|uniref:hypothetical protein n=1 Tax=Pontibacter sp. H249 TaxID=3133420 RepID=UPI0030BA3CEB